MALIDLTDIPASRVQQALMMLLDGELDDVISVLVDRFSVTAVVYAKDEDGHRFLQHLTSGGDPEVATHTLTRRVRWATPQPEPRRERLPDWWTPDGYVPGHEL